MPAVLTYIGKVRGYLTGTFTAVPIGAASPDRIVIVAAVSGGAGAALDTMTIGGNAATQQVINSGSDGYNYSAIYTLAVPTGTTANIVCAANSDQINLYIYTATGLRSATPASTANVSHFAVSSVLNLNVPDGGLIIGCSGGWNSTGSTTEISTSSNALQTVDEAASYNQSGQSWSTYSGHSTAVAKNAAYPITFNENGSQSGWNSAVAAVWENPLNASPTEFEWKPPRKEVAPSSNFRPYQLGAPPVVTVTVSPGIPFAFGFAAYGERAYGEIYGVDPGLPWLTAFEKPKAPVVLPVPLMQQFPLRIPVPDPPLFWLTAFEKPKVPVALPERQFQIHIPAPDQPHILGWLTPFEAPRSPAALPPLMTRQFPLSIPIPDPVPLTWMTPFEAPKALRIAAPGFSGIVNIGITAASSDILGWFTPLGLPPLAAAQRERKTFLIHESVTPPLSPHRKPFVKGYIIS